MSHSRESETIRVVSWNIHKCVGGTDGRYDPQRIIDCLGAYDAKVILLQEVARDMPRLRHNDQVAILSEGLGMHRSEEHTSELQSRENLVCRLLLEKKNKR